MAMYPLMEWQLFPPGGGHALSQQKLLFLLEATVRANQEELRSKGSYPLLYESGVVYKEEPPGKENWADIPTVLNHKWGDCEDLAAWLCAELREVFKVPCRPFLKFRKRGGAFRYHALLILPNGWRNDVEIVRRKGRPVIGTNGQPVIRKVRKPVFHQPWVFEDPSARLGMGGRPFTNQGAYGEIIAKASDPLRRARRNKRRLAA